MFENKLTDDGQPICPSCELVLPREPIVGQLVTTPAGLWIMHKSCVEAWNARAQLLSDMGLAPSVPNQQPRTELGDTESWRQYREFRAQQARTERIARQRRLEARRQRPSFTEAMQQLFADWEVHTVYTSREVHNKLSGYYTAPELVPSMGAVIVKLGQMADRGSIVAVRLAGGTRAWMKTPGF